MAVRNLRLRLRLLARSAWGSFSGLVFFRAETRLFRTGGSSARGATVVGQARGQMTREAGATEAGGPRQGVRRSARRRDGALAFFAKNARVSLSDAPNTMLQSPRATATAYVGEHLQKTTRVRADPEENTVMRPSRAQL